MVQRTGLDLLCLERVKYESGILFIGSTTAFTMKWLGFEEYNRMTLF